MINDSDLKHLRRCIELARTALENGDEPFGSVLVSANGDVLAEDLNRVGGGDHTQHPEFALARWAAGNMASQERKRRQYIPRANIVLCEPLPMDGLVWAESFT